MTYLGANPVFIDASPETWTMDPRFLEEELRACADQGRLPKAVLPVDLYGQCADYDSIREVCARYEVPILEDAAEALGAAYRERPAGSLGDVGVFSFNGNKIVTTSGGGMLVCAREDWAKKARFWASQARDPAPHYQHSEIGYNYRLSNLLAALGRAQLQSLDERVAKRRAIRTRYEERLAGCKGISFMPEAAYGRSNAWLTCLTFDAARFGADAETVRLALEAIDIEARPLWKPMHLQPVYSGCRVRGGEVSGKLFRQGLCLPSGSSLRDEDQDRVCDAVLGQYKGSVRR